MYEWYIYKEKEKNQLRVILFVRFRISHVFIHITLTSLTFKPSFIHGLSNPYIGLRPYLEKLKIRVEPRYSIFMIRDSKYFMRNSCMVRSSLQKNIKTIIWEIKKKKKEIIMNVDNFKEIVFEYFKSLVFNILQQKKKKKEYE